MTYKESLEIAFRYADSQESDFDYKEMFYTLADEAQKLIATNGRRIMKKASITVGSDLSCTLPEDFFEFAPNPVTDSDGETVAAVQYEDGKLMLFAPGEYTLSYYALPQKLTAETPDDYEYEVDKSTHEAIPYYIAYRLVGTDDITLYTALKNQWDYYMSLFRDKPRAHSVRIKNVYGRDSGWR